VWEGENVAVQFGFAPDRLSHALDRGDHNPADDGVKSNAIRVRPMCGRSGTRHEAGFDFPRIYAQFAQLGRELIGAALLAVGSETLILGSANCFLGSPIFFVCSFIGDRKQTALFVVTKKPRCCLVPEKALPYP
jgi:hypothetical protein